MELKQIEEAIYEAFEAVNERKELKTFIMNELFKAVNDAEFESKHPRKENGQFSSADSSEIKTTQEEKQKKINSVNIDPTKDNILPELNQEEQDFLGVSNYPVRLKKKIFEINAKHNDVNKGDDNYIIGSALYSPENVVPAKTDGYYHFIKRVHDDRNSLVLLDVNINTTEGYLDVVHYYYTNDKGRKRVEKNH